MTLDNPSSPDTSEAITTQPPLNPIEPPNNSGDFLEDTLDGEEDETIVSEMVTRSEHISTASRLAEVLKLIDKLIADDPSIEGRIRDFLDADEGEPSPKVSPTGERMTNLDRILYLMEDGKWRSLQRISEKSNVTITSVRDIIYKSHPKMFNRRFKPGSKRNRQFRINKEEVNNEIGN